MVTERNWLEVYPYTKWGGNDSLPHLQEGQTFMPSHLMLKEVCLGLNCNAGLTAQVVARLNCLIIAPCTILHFTAWLTALEILQSQQATGPPGRMLSASQ